MGKQKRSLLHLHLESSKENKAKEAQIALDNEQWICFGVNSDSERHFYPALPDFSSGQTDSTKLNSFQTSFGCMRMLAS